MNNATQHSGARAMVGAWSTDRILSVLGRKVAMAAMGGRPQPVAALVVARIEGASK